MFFVVVYFFVITLDKELLLSLEGYINFAVVLKALTVKSNCKIDQSINSINKF